MLVISICLTVCVCAYNRDVILPLLTIQCALLLPRSFDPRVHPECLGVAGLRAIVHHPGEEWAVSRRCGGDVSHFLARLAFSLAEFFLTRCDFPDSLNPGRGGVTNGALWRCRTHHRPPGPSPSSPEIHPSSVVPVSRAMRENPRVV